MSAAVKVVKAVRNVDTARAVTVVKAVRQVDSARAVETVRTVAAISREGPLLPNPVQVVSAASFPLRGFKFVVSTPSLYCTVFVAVILSLIFTIAIVTATFTILLPLQARAIAKAADHRTVPSTRPPRIEVWVWAVCVVICLLEIAVFLAATTIVALPLFLDSIFDKVLKMKGLKTIQPDNPALQPRTIGFIASRNAAVAGRLLWRKWRKTFLFSGVQLLALVASLPLNLVPGVGSAAWVAANGLLLGWDSHLHYLVDYRGMSLKESKDHVWRNKYAYTTFGAAAFSLSIVPLVNVVFAISNTVGAALWCVEIEKQRGNYRVNISETTTLLEGVVAEPNGGGVEEDDLTAVSGAGEASAASTANSSPKFSRPSVPPLAATLKRLKGR